MEIIHTIEQMKIFSRTLNKAGKSIGLVPTMGALHDGHKGLIAAARESNDIVVVSIYTNPLQFVSGEDFEAYPRDLERDKKIAEESGSDCLFVPTDNEMYPADYLTLVAVKKLTDLLCGLSRPGHFDGVTVIVTKLFNIVKPDRVYFGEKDFQQLAVIRRMTKDLNSDTEIIGIPTVRNKDGLAVSSRNRYLSSDERMAALSLYRSLQTAQIMAAKGERSSSIIISKVEQIIESEELSQIDYIQICDPETIQPVDRIAGKALLALAVTFGKARLIDNCILDLEKN